jgi:LysW-gamma-L-lysine/LysW-L-ornithine aminotransferase
MRRARTEARVHSPPGGGASGSARDTARDSAPDTARDSARDTTQNGDARMLRAFAPKPFHIVRGEGAAVWDDQGRSYLDFGGASHGAALLGHNPPTVVAAIQEQASRLIELAPTVPNDARSRFLDRLHGLLPPQLETTFLANSGTEAVECALKLALARDPRDPDAPARRHLVALQGAFHGRTLGALSASHRPAFRDPFQHALVPTTFAAPDADALAAAVTRDTAAIILEPVQGEGGVHPVPTPVLRAARELADDTGALLIFDEVQSGMGRTGTFLASQTAGVVPDVVTLGKGLAGGLPIGTCSATPEAAARLPPASHGTTYGGNPLVAAAGDAALRMLVEEDLMARATRLGDDFAAALAHCHPGVAAVRHAGLMVGVDLRVRSASVMQRLQDDGFLALQNGPRGVRFLPPFVVHPDDLAACTIALYDALEAGP